MIFLVWDYYKQSFYKHRIYFLKCLNVFCFVWEFILALESVKFLVLWNRNSFAQESRWELKKALCFSKYGPRWSTSKSSGEFDKYEGSPAQTYQMRASGDVDHQASTFCGCYTCGETHLTGRSAQCQKILREEGVVVSSCPGNQLLPYFLRFWLLAISQKTLPLHTCKMRSQLLPSSPSPAPSFPKLSPIPTLLQMLQNTQKSHFN